MYYIIIIMFGDKIVLTVSKEYKISCSLCDNNISITCHRITS